MYTSETQLRVRYADTDQMGVVYYGNYATYYEVGRVEAFRQLGLSYKEMEARGVMMPVLELNCKYLLPAKYDELLTIKTSISEIPMIKIRYSYEIYNEEQKLINTGSTTLAFLDANTHKPVKMPDYLAEILNPYF